MLFFEFPEDARWNPDREAVEFSVILELYEGTVRIARRVFQRLLDQSPTPERCMGAFHLQRTRFERDSEDASITGAATARVKARPARRQLPSPNPARFRFCCSGLRPSASWPVAAACLHQLHSHAHIHPADRIVTATSDLRKSSRRSPANQK